MSPRRVLVTGLSTVWGGRLAQMIEAEPSVEVVIGVDDHDPRVALERTEFVKTTNQHALIRRIVEAAEIDTVVDTRMVVDSASTTPRKAHENNVIGTMNILAGCSGAHSPVRKLIFKSTAHYYGCEQDDPAFFTEEMRRPHAPQTMLERDVLEAERAVADFAARSPETTVTILRFANGVGPTLDTSHMRLLRAPLVPTILGFDPRYQFIHETDIAGVLAHAAMKTDMPGVFNAAADGVLVLSEVLDLLGKRAAPILPPWGTEVVAGQLLARLGLRTPPEMLRQLRFGRGLDNRKLKATGYELCYTTREALVALRRSEKTGAITRGQDGGYVWEREVEEFLRRSPSVVRREPAAVEAPALGPGLAVYDELKADEVIAAVATLESADLEELRRYEAEHRKRTTVLRAIDRRLARSG